MAYKEQTFISQVLETGKSKIMVLTDLVSGENWVLSSYMAVLSPCLYVAQGDNGPLKGVFYKGTNPFTRAPAS